MMQAFVIDVETTVNCPLGTNKAHPKWPGNKVVMACTSGVDSDALAVIDRSLYLHHVNYFIGQNIKFDIQYSTFVGDGTLPTIFDIQAAEYILTGQRHKFATLNELITKYLNESYLKDDDIKKHWDAGGKTEDIDPKKLEAYLKNDVEATKLIFKKQWHLLEDAGQLQLALAIMDSIRATTVMANNGLKADVSYIHKQIAIIETGMDVCIDRLKFLTGGELDEATISSNKQLSLYFFGGITKKTENRHEGFYKNGKPKMKKYEVDVEVKGLEDPKKYTKPSKLDNTYIVDEPVLKELAKKYMEAGFILDYRKYKKLKTTYYEGIRDLLFPGNFVYPNISHCATHTGRLACSQPNLQNQTDLGGVKKSFISRFDDGYLLELDYSQLEIVALAYLANDKQLIEDINNNVDIHTALYETMFGRAPSKEERKAFKPLTFLLVYGGSAYAMSKQTEFPVPFCQNFIATFYNRYKGVEKYHGKLWEDAHKYMEYDTEIGAYTYTLKSKTGRKYVFTKYKNADGTSSFSKNELYNWPVQGFATGDIVPIMVGLLQRELDNYKHKDKALLINTVHDSVLLDVDISVVEEVAHLCKKVLESAPEMLKSLFDIDFGMKLKVGVSYGKNWGSQTEFPIV